MIDASVTCIGRILVSGVIIGGALAGHAQADLGLVKNDVVVFLGGANMVHLQQAGYLEAMLTQAFASERPKFRDLSWEADTVFRQGTVVERWRAKAHFDDDGGLGDLNEQLKRLGATVVIAQFGQLESMVGEQGLDEFTAAYVRLIDLIQQHTRQVVLVTPTPFETPTSANVPDLSQRNADLALYVKATKELARKRKLIFVDLFAEGRGGLTDDGMHVKREAQRRVARIIARQLGVWHHLRASGKGKPQAGSVRHGEITDLEPLRRAVVEKHRLWYDYWRPANWKLLFGDDARRQFTRGEVPFREEWKKLVPMIAQAEDRVWTIASGGNDPSHNRPKPEVLHGDSTADIENELAAISVPEGMQVNLFAFEKDGLTSPLNLRWDPAGRMYVTVTTTYPHVFPGDVPNDKIILLEDTDHDGKADKSTVFADGLNIPTGIEWGDGGVYVGQNTEILFLKDNDGDGKADERRVLLGGFGNGDSHQTISSFVWSPDGQLYFGHGDGCESRVETPWGASNLFNAGYYKLQPRRLQLIPFLEGHMGPGNPWGVGFDAWGQIFDVDGAGGVSWLSPAQVSTTHRRRLPRIGDPGGYCGIAYLDGRHLPKSMHGDFVVGDFKANRVKRFSLTDAGAGFSLEWKEPLLRSRDRNFRPVDVKVGPDGAIYVVDWYNPITCHQDDAYRDPRRDKAHGRIWRVSVKGSTRISVPDLSTAPLGTVLDALKSSEYWSRYQAKRALTERDPAAAAGKLDNWVRSLDPKHARYEYHLLQALCAYATIEVVEPNLLNRLLHAADPRGRAFAARMVGRWHDRLDEKLSLLADCIADDHPRVRMEAIVACSTIPSARAIEVVAAVTDRPMDSGIEYAFKQTVQRLKPYWLPAFNRGELSFASPRQLAAVLNETGGDAAVNSLRRLVDSEDLDRQTRVAAIAAVLAVGGPDDLRSYGLDRRRFTHGDDYDAALHAEVLTRLVQVAKSRDVRPAGDTKADLGRLIKHTDSVVQANAIQLAGLWKVDALQNHVLAAAKNEKLAESVRAAALKTLGEMRLADGRELLVGYSRQLKSPVLRAAAIQSLVDIDMPTAAQAASDYFRDQNPTVSDATAILLAFLNRKDGPPVLAAALRNEALKPEQAKLVLRALFATGRSDTALFNVLNNSLGARAKPPEYSTDLVQQLATAATRDGRAERGALVFQSLACSSCHKVGGSGGDVGPDLTALGTTLSAERITEELLWPGRQVKEGYATIVVVTTDGRVHTGYERVTKQSVASGDVVMQDVAAKKLITIKKEDVEKK